MCSPTTATAGAPGSGGMSGLASLSLGLSGVGATMGAVGAYAGAGAQKADLRSQAFINGINAQMAESSAQGALQQGQRQAQGFLLRGAQVKSAQRASLAANGVDLGSRSAVDVTSSTDISSQIDANTAEANAVRTAWGYRTQATNFSNQALMERAQAGAINPLLSGATSLLGSAGQVADKWYMFNRWGN